MRVCDGGETREPLPTSMSGNSCTIMPSGRANPHSHSHSPSHFSRVNINDNIHNDDDDDNDDVLRSTQDGASRDTHTRDRAAS